MGELPRATREKAVRLVTVAAAMARQPTPLRWMREQLGLYDQARESASRQMFERDKRALQEAGLVIELDEDNRYSIGATSAPSFTEDELDALTVAAGLVADPATGTALAAFAARADAYPRVERTDRVLANLPEAPALAEAIDGRRAVRFAYRSASGPVEDRVVEPWVLRARRGMWYVLGWDRTRADHRNFRLDRIVGEIELDDEATTQRPVDLPALLPGEAGPVTMRLGDRGGFEARRLRARLGDVEPDGTRLASFDALRDEEALGFALRHDAVIVEPAELDRERSLRARFVAELHARDAHVPPASLDDGPARDPALPTARLRRLLLLGGWLAERVGVTVDETCRGLGCSREELLEDIGVLQDVQLPGVGDVFDLYVDEADTIQHIIEVSIPVELDALDRGRVRALLGAADELVDEADRPGLRALASRLDTAVVVALDPDGEAELLRRLQQARDERRRVTFRYRKRTEEDGTERRVTPTELAWVDGHAYLGGWDHDAEDGRTFRLDRLAELQVGDEDPAPYTVELATPRYVPEGDETEVVLRCTHVGSWVLARLLPERRVTEPDGTVWAVVRTDTPEVVADNAMIGGGEVEVVSPDALRDLVAARAAGLH